MEGFHFSKLPGKVRICIDKLPNNNNCPGLPTQRQPLINIESTEGWQLLSKIKLSIGELKGMELLCVQEQDDVQLSNNNQVKINNCGLRVGLTWLDHKR